MRDALVQQLLAHVDAVFTQLSPQIPYLAYLRGDVDRNITALTGAVSEANTIVSDAKNSIQIRTQEIEQLAVTAREVAAKSGIAIFRKDFVDEANAHATSAGNWLKATTGLAVTTVVISLAYLGFVPHPTNAFELAQVLTSKILLLATLISATVWCGRLYRTSKHQEAVNRHRANALLTFQAFSQAASDDMTRNAVLLETTRSIFAHAPSDYISEGQASSDGGLKVFEMVRGFSSPQNPSP